MNSDPYLIPPPEKNSKWTLHLNTECSIIKRLEANTGENGCDSGLGKYFFIPINNFELCFWMHLSYLETI